MSLAWYCWIHIEWLEYFRASADSSVHKDKIRIRQFFSWKGDSVQARIYRRTDGNHNDTLADFLAM